MDASDNCIICFNTCVLKRKDIEPYKCTCIYYIHRTCYQKWKLTGTQRLCVLCQVSDIPRTYIAPLEDLRRPVNILDRNFIQEQYLIEQQIYEERHRNRRIGCQIYVLKICSICIFVFVVFKILLTKYNHDTSTSWQLPQASSLGQASLEPVQAHGLHPLPLLH